MSATRQPRRRDIPPPPALPAKATHACSVCGAPVTPPDVLRGRPAEYCGREWAAPWRGDGRTFRCKDAAAAVSELGNMLRAMLPHLALVNRLDWRARCWRLANLPWNKGLRASDPPALPVDPDGDTIAPWCLPPDLLTSDPDPHGDVP